MSCQMDEEPVLAWDKSSVGPESSYRRLFKYDPRIGYTFIPNLRTRVPHESGGYLVATNSLGFRDERTPNTTSARRNVFVFGDSFTAGDGVSNGFRFSDRLQKYLAGTDVYNFGLPGTGTDQQMIAYCERARTLPCDLLIIAVWVQNIRRITSQFRPAEMENGQLAFAAKPYFELVDGRLTRFNDPVPEDMILASQLADTNKIDKGGRFPALRRLVNALGLKDTVQWLTHFQPVHDYDDPNSTAWQLMRAILLEWGRVHRGPILVLPLPLYQHVEETASPLNYQARFSELANDGRFVVHDVLPDLLKYDKAERREFRFRTDIHWTRAGHEAVARSLAPVVANLLAGYNQPLEIHL